MGMTDTAVQDVAWDLEPLVNGTGPVGVEALLDDAQEHASAVAAQRGNLGSLDGDAFLALMQDLAAVHEAVGRAGSYAGLRFAVDTTDPSRGALMAKVEERSNTIGNQLIFFTLEWAGLDDDVVAARLADERLDFCRHYLEEARKNRPYLLTEPEELILSEKSLTSTNAWVRLFTELDSAITVELDGETVGLETALSRLAHPDRAVRAAAHAAVTAGLAPGIRTRAFVFNTLLQDKATEDRLRGFPTWISSRNLENEATDESVDALVAAVRSRYDIPQRWYSLKAKLLGIDKLADYDRMASVATQEAEFGWDEAQGLVLDAYSSFSPELATIARRFFDESWIDAPVRPGKRSGAFCAYTTPSQHPYLMLNWTSKRRDVLTLAHEMGHGLHGYLARPQGVFHQSTPLTLAETASVFGETVTFGLLLDQTPDPDARLALLAESLEGAIATVFRQTAMNRFEALVHTERREVGELSVDRFNELWTESQCEMLGDAVEVTEGYHAWWSYIPHFIATPGYVYAYAYGQLLALSVYREYQTRGAEFVPKYLEMLSAGGSRSPQELGEIVGVDLADPGFWAGGLEIVENQLVAAEAAAAAAGRL
jgi:oligoendopeptidase F